MTTSPDNQHAGGDNTPQATDDNTQKTEDNRCIQMGARVYPKDKAWFESYKKGYPNAAEAFQALVASAMAPPGVELKEVVREVEKEVIKEVPAEIPYPGFVTIPDEQLVNDMRKARKFFYEEGMSDNPDRTDYPGELAKYAIRFLFSKSAKKFNHIFK